MERMAKVSKFSFEGYAILPEALAQSNLSLEIVIN